MFNPKEIKYDLNTNPLFKGKSPAFYFEQKREKDKIIDDNSFIQLSDELIQNLSNSITLRPYQGEEALANFVTYYNVNKENIRLAFHMATGSGKTVVMAALILFLYEQGYKNFIFLVNSTAIVEKTLLNFIDSTSPKYLFAKDIRIGNKSVKINQVETFPDNSEDINIKFSTIQKLFLDLTTQKENALTLHDLEKQKYVVISDEAHHINVDTKKKLTDEEKEEKASWETIVNKIVDSHEENILLEFTATLELDDQSIQDKYIPRIIMNYDLARFRREKYSKEIELMKFAFKVNQDESEVLFNKELFKISLEALITSQLRLKIFQENKIFSKPIILLKSKSIKESQDFHKIFFKELEKLTFEEFLPVYDSTIKAITDGNEYDYDFSKFKTIDFLNELKKDFNQEKAILVNSKDNILGRAESRSKIEDIQTELNSLEDPKNIYRMIFVADMLNEGWDVLNLFDIVRLYKTTKTDRSEKGKNKTTISEAQLIGRGARYFPFEIKETETIKRKFDEDPKNPLRICEQLYFHCDNDVNYINQIRKELIRIGLLDKEKFRLNLDLKDSFIKSKFYTEGYVWYNKEDKKVFSYVFDINKLITEIKPYLVKEGSSALVSVFTDEESEKDPRKEFSINIPANVWYQVFTEQNRITVNDIISSVKNGLDDLFNLNEFLLVLSKLSIKYKKSVADLTFEEIYLIAKYTLKKIIEKILKKEKSVKGSEFNKKKISEVFTSKILNFTNEKDTEDQQDFDVSKEDWYAYTKNFGTDQERELASYIRNNIDYMKEKGCSDIYLVRNERQLPIYNTSSTEESGSRFEPDYILFFSKTGFKYQIFIEPKGSNLILEQEWKNNFLKCIKVVNNDYKVYGLPFFNTDPEILKQFEKEFKKTIEIK